MIPFMPPPWGEEPDEPRRAPPDWSLLVLVILTAIGAVL